MVPFRTLIVIGVVFIIQVFLSRTERRWPGLVLPALTFVYSIVAVLGGVLYLGQTAAETAVMVLSILFSANIPTLILLAIYFACRGNYRKAKELEKMNIQDLE